MIRVCAENSTIGHGDKFTIGTVVQTLSSLSQTRYARNTDKHSIRENIIRALQQEDICQSRFHLGKPLQISSSNFKTLRQSLKEQVENAKTKPKKTRYVNKLHRYHEESIYNSNNEVASVSLPIKDSAPDQNCTSEQSEDQGVQLLFVNDNLNNGEEVSGGSDAMKEMLIKHNIYSRHLQDNAKDFVLFRSENDVLVDGLSGSTGQEEGTQRHRRKSRRESVASSVISNASTPSRKRSQSKASEVIQREDKEKNKSEDENENDFVSGISDPTLKDSMKKIMQRRKSVLCLFKSSAGLKVLSENEAFEFSPIIEENSSIVSELESETIKSESSANFEEAKSDAGTYLKENDTDPSYLPSSISLPLNATMNFRRKGILKQQSQLSKSFAQKSHSARATCTKNKIETEETKVIIPLSTNAWRPSLVPKQLKKRSTTARSFPETRKEKKKILAEKNKDDVIRDFIIMYAKVKNKTQIDQDVTYCEQEVRMISQTPEFVVKSTIGQFLTSPLHTGRNNASDSSSEEKYEAKQRTKLIKIKNCMLQLADLV